MTVLTDHPRIFTLGNLVVIEYEKGKQMSWTLNNNEVTSFLISEEMNLESKLHYMNNFIDQLLENMLEPIKNIVSKQEIYALLAGVLEMKLDNIRNKQSSN